MTPTVSVIMATYNQAPYIAASVQSVLTQTYTDCELIIIDDASTDATPDIIAAFDDPRINFLRNPHNVGSSAARNRGLESASGDYIAIADGDDLCLPQRIEKQVAFMEQHPEVGVLGTQYQTINARGKKTNKAFRMPTSHNLIVWEVFTGYPIAHTTAMIRASAWDAAGRHYDEERPTSEDFELWLRMIFVTRFANLEDVLVQYRHWPGAQSIATHPTQRQSSMETFSRTASSLLGKPVPGAMRWHLAADDLKYHLLTEEQAQKSIELQLELYQALLDRNVFDPEHLDDVRSRLAARATMIARHSPKTLPLMFRTLVMLGRVHAPFWMRQLWGRVKALVTNVQP